MENKILRHVTITDRIHIGGPSWEIVSKFKRLIEKGIVEIQRIKLFTIDYNTSTGDVFEGPVHIYFDNGLAIYLNLVAGYSGTGPTDLCEIMEICEINFNKDDILTDQEYIKLRYCTDNEIAYKFDDFNGTYEYAM